MPSLASLLPPDRLLLSPVETSLYQSDALPALSQRPAAVAFPVSSDEVVALLRFCHQHDLPFIPRGSGTGLRGACCPPAADFLVISLQQMDQILSVDPAERTATVQPGVSPDRLDREAGLHGLRYLPNPACRRSATLGGNLALDAAGPNAHPCGSTASQILAATVILPDGSVADCGGPPAFGSLGPGPLHLLSRSEGTLGIVVEMTLALTALPESQSMLTASFSSLLGALEAADSLLFSGMLPALLEIFDARTWHALIRPEPPDPAPGAILWCVLEGPAEEIAEESPLAADLLRRCGALGVDPLSDPGRREFLFQRRNGLFSSLGNVLIQDAAVPRSRLSDSLRFLGQLENEEGVPVSVSLNGASGNLFPAFHFETARLESFRRAERAAARFLLHCAESGGTVSGCHGLGREKRGLFASVIPEEEIRFEQELQGAFAARAREPVAATLNLFPPLPGETPLPNR